MEFFKSWKTEMKTKGATRELYKAAKAIFPLLKVSIDP